MSYLIRLAINHLKRSKKDLLPYLISLIVIFTLAMTVQLLYYSPSIKLLEGADSMLVLLKFGVIIILIFGLIFSNYTHHFWFESEQKEFGLFLILGMKKKDISKIIGISSLTIFILTSIIGMIASFFLAKFLLLLVVYMLKGVDFTLHISFKAIASIVGFYLILLLILFFKDIFTIHFKKLQNLLKQEQIGEKEPKARWILSIIGLTVIAIAYYIALTIKNPLDGIFQFFIAIILVIVGTYILFVFGIVTYFKWRKKRPNYYQPKNFIQVSGMLFRMKQNAVGLASISILVVMTLVTVMSTTSLYFGLQETIDNQFPKNSKIYPIDNWEPESFNNEVEKIAAEYNVKLTNKSTLTGIMDISGNLTQDGKMEHMNGFGSNKLDKTKLFSLSTIPNYNELTGSSVQLNNNEVLIYTYGNKLNIKNITLNNRKYKVKQIVETTNGLPKVSIETIFESMIIFFNNSGEFPELTQGFYFLSGEEISPESTKSIIYTDVEGSKENIDKFVSNAVVNNFIVTTKNDTSKALNAFAGGFLFIGILLGFSFILATTIIIYYKQVSAGIDDKNRFEVMQKVGLSKNEIQKSIKRQIGIVFFLPVIVAIIHFVVALPMILKMLALFEINPGPQLYLVIAITVLSILVLYFIVYRLTSRVYYQLIERKA